MTDENNYEEKSPVEIFQELTEDDAHEFVFYGRIYPERTDVDIPTQISELSGGKYEGKLLISIFSSQITVIVRTSDEIDNILTLKNMVQKAVHLHTDQFSFIRGYYYDTELTAGVTPDNHTRIFGVISYSVEEKVSDMEDEELRKISHLINQMYTQPEGDYLRRSLTDFRMAMQYPDDTGVFCYRAIESLRHYFKDEFDIDDDDEDSQWEKLREELDKEEDELKEIAHEYSAPRRHGERVAMTSEIREYLFVYTWELIHDFLKYAEDEILD